MVPYHGAVWTSVSRLVLEDLRFMRLPSTLAGVPMEPDALRAVRRRTGAQRVAKNKARILDAAERLFVSAGNLSTTSAELARQSGLSVATIYQLYPGGKPTVAAALWYELFQRRPTPPTHEVTLGISAVARYVQDLATFGLEHIHLTNALLLAVQSATVEALGPPVAPSDPRNFAPLPSDLAPVVAAAQSGGGLRRDQPPLVLATYIVNSTLNRVMTRPRETPEQSFGFTWTMLTQGIATTVVKPRRGLASQRFSAST